MFFSKSFISTTYSDPKIAECRSHRFLLKGSFIYPVASGIYAYLPLGWKVLDNLCNIIRKYMNSKGAEELFLTALQPLSLWKVTGRDKVLDEVMFKFKDRKQRELCLGPTHEEEITEIAKKFISSYRQMPVILYQIQTKFRDEPRPRYGLLRGSEFIMKDAYSFDIDHQGLKESYEKMLSAYEGIFKECGLSTITMEADTGAMGGELSHEFLVESDIGEDILNFCSGCNKFFKNKENCPHCSCATQPKRMIELGHIFQLGTKYSKIQEAFFLDRDGIRKPIIMGCYGIGVSRLLAAIAEVNSDEKGIIWPVRVSPFVVNLIVLENKLFSRALEIVRVLEKEGIQTLVDEREVNAGVKFNDAYLLGSPLIAILGKNYLKNNTIDLEIRKTAQKYSFSFEEFIKFCLSYNNLS